MIKSGEKVQYTTVKGNPCEVEVLSQYEGGAYKVIHPKGERAMYICYGQGKVYTIQKGRQRTVGYL
jgi:hypothetical protein